MSEEAPIENNQCEMEEGKIDHSDHDINKQLMKNPEVLAALQSQLAQLGPSPADYIRSLPKPVKRRLKALKKLQSEANKIESKFFEEVHQLECKYAEMYDQLHQKRRDIVIAKVEPTDTECDWPSDEEDEDIAEELKSKAVLEDSKDTGDSDVKGVPDFWLTVFKNVDMLAEMVQEHDEPILKHLQDIKLHMNANTGFMLEFIFEPNEFFTNTSLTKEYTYRFGVDEANPLAYEGPEIIKCKGCAIDWQKGKNVTVKLVKKVQKHKGRGTKRTITKTVQADSFFNFFNPPQISEDDTDPDEDIEAILAADFEIGHFLREHIVPRAVLYFTGEALDDDDDEYDEDGEDDDEEEDDDDEDDDDVDSKSHPAIMPSKGKK